MFLKKLCFAAVLLLSTSSLFSQVGINTSAPNAQLEIRATNQAAPSNTDGILIPKVDAFPAANPTAAQQGMMLYLTTASGTNPAGFYYWDNLTSSWIGFVNSKGWELAGNSGTTPATHFLGTTDNQPLALRTNNAEQLRITSGGNVGIGTTNPQNKLHVSAGATGMTPNPGSVATIENTTPAYFSLLSNSESGVLFGANGNATNGAIVYNSPALPDGMLFRNSGNVNRMVIGPTGNIGLGNFIPTYPLQFPNALGDKISLWGGGANHYGLGVQGNLLQVHADTALSDVAFGHGSSAAFTETMRVKGNGNVGIGTSAPGAKFHLFNGASGLTPNGFSPAVIEGTGFTYLNVISTTETGVVFGSGGTSTNGGIVYNSGIYTNGMNFRTGGNQNRMSISAAGQVSIGNALADARLHVMSSNQAAPANTDGIIIPKVDAFPAVNPTAAQLGMMVYLTTAVGANKSGFYYWNGSAWTSFMHGGSGWATVGNAGTTPATNFIGTTDNQPLVVKTNNAERLRVDAAGSTGIGTASPLSKLHVFNGASAMVPNPFAAATIEGNGFTFLNVLSTSETGVVFGSGGNNTNGGIVYNSGIYANGMNFRTGGNQNRMNISSAGDVSIGDVLADARLQIVSSNQVTPANTDGILIPRIDTFPLTNPTAAQNGMMVFLTTTIGQYVAGFYYWDNAAVSWIAVGSKSSWSTTGNLGTAPATQFIGTNDNAGLAVRTNGSERIRVSAAGDVGINTTNPTAELEVNGFTKLGSTAPAVKLIKLTATTNVAQGGQTLIVHGLNSTKILSVSVLVEYTAGAGLPPNYTTNPGYEYEYFFNSTSIIVWNKAANSANILSKPVRVLVTYEE